MATIGDVAREAGVARSTASSVLSGKKYVSPEITARVLEAVEKLEYTVNQGARALATSRTMTIGVVVTQTVPHYDASIGLYMIALADAARLKGYNVLLLTDADGEKSVTEAIAARQVDGLVLLNVLEDDPRLGPIRERNFPAVLLGMPSGNDDVDAVDLDFPAAGRLLASRAVESGSKKGTLIAWPPELYEEKRTYATRFLRAVREASAEAGFSLELVHSPADPEKTLEFLTELLSSEDRPELLLIHNDVAAAMLPLAVSRLGLDVPKDMQVGSLHSQALANQYAIPYTAVESGPAIVSTIAIDMLVSRLDGDRKEQARQLVEPAFVDRGTL